MSLITIVHVTPSLLTLFGMVYIRAHHPPVNIGVQKLTPVELRYQIFVYLAKRVKANGKLDKTALADAAETFGCSVGKLGDPYLR